MPERMHVLAQQLLGKNALEECSLTEINALVTRYPYMASAHFLLLHKLQQEGSPDYTAQLQRSILYFPDPVRFQYLVNPERFHTAVEIASPEEEPVNEELINEVEVHEEVVETEPESMEVPSPVEEPLEAQTMETETVVRVEEPLSRPVLDKNMLSQPVKEDAIAFEPYHTVDYFASQGIKLSLAEIPKDKFGKQLKSFTDWLKTMKRIPDPAPGQGVTHSEKNIQNLAHHSITEADVWTEAMAEVWIKQGNRQKAIHVYNKLSLLNPSKKAYFAGKIENLKQS